MSQFTLETIHDATGFEQGTRRALQSAQAMDKGLQQLSQGALGVNKAFQLYEKESGRFASATKVLNRLGIQTTEQLEEQIAAYNLLIETMEGDVAATAQLTARKRALQEQLEGVTTRSRGGSRAAQQLGFILNDVQQFSVGAAAGLRSISNNVGPLVAQLGVGGPLIIAVEALSTAAVILGPKLAEAFSSGSKAAKEFREKVDEASESLIHLAEPEQFRDLTFEEAQQNLAEVQSLAEAYRLQIERLEREFAAPDITFAEELEEARARIQRQLEAARENREEALIAEKALLEVVENRRARHEAVGAVLNQTSLTQADLVGQGKELTAEIELQLDLYKEILALFAIREAGRVQKVEAAPLEFGLGETELDKLNDRFKTAIDAETKMRAEAERLNRTLEETGETGAAAGEEISKAMRVVESTMASFIADVVTLQVEFDKLGQVAVRALNAIVEAAAREGLRGVFSGGGGGSGGGEGGGGGVLGFLGSAGAFIAEPLAAAALVAAPFAALVSAFPEEPAGGDLNPLGFGLGGYGGSGVFPGSAPDPFADKALAARGGVGVRFATRVDGETQLVDRFARAVGREFDKRLQALSPEDIAALGKRGSNLQNWRGL